MAKLVREVLETVRALINDEEAIMYPDFRVLPKLKIAQEELFNRLILADHTITFVQSSIMTVPGSIADGGTTSLNALTGFPVGFRVPMNVFERPSGGNASQFILVGTASFIPIQSQLSMIQFWSWVNDSVVVNTPTSSRQVLLQYRGAPLATTGLTDDVLVEGAEIFLSYRTAALMYSVQSAQDPRASLMAANADAALQVLLRTMTKQHQARPVRAMAYRGVR